MTGEERLPHGYTNATRRTGDAVVKRYLGPDAAARRDAEVAALRSLAGRVPVPPLLQVTADEVLLGFVAGRPGQEVLVEQPGPVLYAVGRAARTLPVELVHGDFGPQNMLLDADTLAPTAILDWEWAHRGDRVEDLAWAEWIVRTHHADLAWALPALYEGYGDEPPWPQRHAAMLAAGRRMLDLTVRWGGPDGAGARQWRTRLAATEAFGDLRS